MGLTVKDQPLKEELAERLDFTFELLSRSLHKSQIKKQIRAKYGDLSARTIESYLSRARDRIYLAIEVSKEHRRSESLAFYDAMSRDNVATVREKILARERIDRLLGLDAPTNININKIESDIERELARLGVGSKESVTATPESDSDAEPGR